MTNLFLKAKHWQLFVLSFAAPLIFQFVFMFNMFEMVETRQEPDFATFIPMLSIFPIIILLSAGTMLGWMWSMAMGLQNKLPQDIKMKTTSFKVFFFIPMIYITGIFFLVGFGLYQQYPSNIEFEDIAWVIALIVPLHLFSIFCMFYCMYFTAKTVRTVELQRETQFSDFVGEFFLIWFSIVGFWVLQPRINKLAKESPNILDAETL